MNNFLFSALLFSTLTQACGQGDYQSNPKGIGSADHSEEMILIRVESTSVKQPMIFASVDLGIGDCHGGTPRFKTFVGLGQKIPDLRVSVSTKSVCILGQATPTGQDSMHYDLPEGLAGGDIVVIKNDELSVTKKSEQVPDPVASKDTVVVRVESTQVKQPMIFASVDKGIGDCRGGNPLSKVSVRQGEKIPDLLVKPSTGMVCILGQATSVGQDSKFYTLPENLKGGEIIVIKNDKVFLENLSPN